MQSLRNPAVSTSETQTSEDDPGVAASIVRFQALEHRISAAEGIRHQAAIQPYPALTLQQKSVRATPPVPRTRCGLSPSPPGNGRSRPARGGNRQSSQPKPNRANGARIGAGNGEYANWTDAGAQPSKGFCSKQPGTFLSPRACRGPCLCGRYHGSGPAALLVGKRTTESLRRQAGQPKDQAGRVRSTLRRPYETYAQSRIRTPADIVRHGLCRAHPRRGH